MGPWIGPAKARFWADHDGEIWKTRPEANINWRGHIVSFAWPTCSSIQGSSSRKGNDKKKGRRVSEIRIRQTILREERHLGQKKVMNKAVLGIRTLGECQED